MASKCKNMLANEKREEHQTWHIPRNGSAATIGTTIAGGGEGVKTELLLNITSVDVMPPSL